MKKFINAFALALLLLGTKNLSAQAKTRCWLDLSPAGINASIAQMNPMFANDFY